MLPIIRLHTHPELEMRRILIMNKENAQDLIHVLPFHVLCYRLREFAEPHIAARNVNL